MSIDEIVRALGEGKIAISNHADEEAENDDLSFDEMGFSVNHGEIIERYATGRPYPSCLVYGDTFGGDPVHSVWGYNQQTRFAVLITVYRPDPALWTEDWKMRRRP